MDSNYILWFCREWVREYLFLKALMYDFSYYLANLSCIYARYAELGSMMDSVVFFIVDGEEGQGHLVGNTHITLFWLYNTEPLELLTTT